jgi:hypothetical protein
MWEEWLLGIISKDVHVIHAMVMLHTTFLILGQRFFQKSVSFFALAIQNTSPFLSSGRLLCSHACIEE